MVVKIKIVKPTASAPFLRGEAVGAEIETTKEIAIQMISQGFAIPAPNTTENATHQPTEKRKITKK